MKKPKDKGRPPARNMPHCNPKWLRKQRRLELEGEAREYEIKFQNELKAAKDVAEETKQAMALAFGNLIKGLYERAARLKGRMPRMARGRG